MVLKVSIGGIIHIFISVTAEMASQMFPCQVIIEYLIIEEVFFAEIAPRVRQDFSLFLVTGISVFDMILQKF